MALSRRQSYTSPRPLASAGLGRASAEDAASRRFSMSSASVVSVSVDTFSPTPAPSPLPSVAPTPMPTLSPTSAPASVPTFQPSAAPSAMPTALPTMLPSLAPTRAPISAPTPVPNTTPSPIPSPAPSLDCTLFEQSTYRLWLYDSGGDGWQGAYYQIFSSTFEGDAGGLTFKEGSLIVDGTMSDGLSEAQSFCLTNGCYELHAGGGSAESEIGLAFVDSVGGYFQDLATPFADHFCVADGDVFDNPTPSPTTALPTAIPSAVPLPVPIPITPSTAPTFVPISAPTPAPTIVPAPPRRTAASQRSSARQRSRSPPARDAGGGSRSLWASLMVLVLHSSVLVLSSTRPLLCSPLTAARASAASALGCVAALVRAAVLSLAAGSPCRWRVANAARCTRRRSWCSCSVRRCSRSPGPVFRSARR